MSDERIDVATVRAAAAHHPIDYEDVLALVAEVEALRAANAALVAERDAAREWAAIVVEHILATPLPPEAIRPAFTVGSVTGACSLLSRDGVAKGGGDGE